MHPLNPSTPTENAGGSNGGAGLVPVGIVDEVHSYPTEKVYKFVLQETISAKIRQLILCISNDEGLFDKFVREVIFGNRR